MDSAPMPSSNPAAAPITSKSTNKPPIAQGREDEANRKQDCDDDECVPAVQHCLRPTGPYRLRILPEMPPLSLVLDQCRQRSGPLDQL